MTRIDKSHIHFLFDQSLTPVAAAKPGDTLVFETLDACCGEVRSVEQLHQRRADPSRKSNPMTGPVFVEGAAVGGTLVVDILRIDLDKEGFQLIGPDRGVVRQEIPDWTCYAFKTVRNQLRFPNGFRLPADPVIGQFGNASAGEPTNNPNRLGGNQDCPAVRVGARLHIPIAVPGALFSLGDVHACQGDGEVAGAPEIGATVTVRLDVSPERHSEWFMIEDDKAWYTCCTADTETEAARLAVFENAKFIEKTHQVALKDALILLTLIGKISISRTGKWGEHGPVVCSSFSKARVAKAIQEYQRA